MAAVRYSRNVNVEFYLDEFYSTSDLHAAVDRIQHANAETNTADAISMMENSIFSGSRGDRADAANIGIVITDGESNVNEQLTIPMAKSAQDEGIRMIAVGVTNNVNLQELRGIASSGNPVVRVQDFSELNTVVESIADLACQEPIGKSVISVYYMVFMTLNCMVQGVWGRFAIFISQ